MEIEKEFENFGANSSSIHKRKNPTTYEFGQSFSLDQSKNYNNHILTQNFIQPKDTRESDRIDEFIYRDDDIDILGNDKSSGNPQNDKNFENGVIWVLKSVFMWFKKQYVYWISSNRIDFRESRTKHELKSWWRDEKASLFIFIAAILVIVFLFKYFEIEKKFVVTRMFVDSHKRMITNPALNTDYETIMFFDIIEIMEMDEWAEQQRHNIPKLNKSNLDAGFIEMDIYKQERKRNVSIELLVKTMESYSDDHSCISALNFGIIQNVILIKRVDKEQVFVVTMYDSFVDTMSYDTVTASIMKKIENEDGSIEEVVAQKIKVPKKIIVDFYDGNYKKTKMSLSGAESACVYQFIELYKTLSHQ